MTRPAGEPSAGEATSAHEPDADADAGTRPTLGVRLQTGLLKGIAAVLRRLPPGAVAGMGSAAGALYGLLARRRRRIAIENLTAALGSGAAPERIRAIARGAFRHFGRVAFETLAMDRYRSPRARSFREAGSSGAPSPAPTLFVFEGIENLRAAYARGRGALLFSAHYGNWEVGVLMMGYLGFPVGVIARPLDNRGLETFMREAREASGNRVISKRNAAKEILRSLRAGMSVAMLIDQNVRSGARVFVDFFGRPASTTPSLALLALKTGVPVLPLFAIPGPGGSYRFICGKELEVPDTGDRDADVLALTQACTRIIEEQVRARPDCWLWMHERWKTRPRKDVA